MSDRTSFQCHIYACPEDQQAAARAILEDEYDLGPEFADDVTEGLNLTAPYFDAEMPLCSAGEIAKKLQEAAPGASFVLWEDPFEQYLGDLFHYTPDLGMFTAECTAGGDQVYDRSQIAAMLAEAVAAHADDDLIRIDRVTDHIHKATGGPWDEDYGRAMLQAAKARASAEPDDVECGLQDKT